MFLTRKIMLSFLVLICGLGLGAAEGYYRDVFYDGGTSLNGFGGASGGTQYTIYPAITVGLGYTYDQYLGSSATDQTTAMVTSANDSNGALLYPDGSPRYRVVFVNGGNSVDHGTALGASGLQRFRDFVDNGGSYVGCCAGAALSSIYRANGTGNYGDQVEPYYFHVYPGRVYTTFISLHWGGHEIPEDSPLKDYGFSCFDDNYIPYVRHNEGNCLYIDDNYPYWLPPEGTVVLANYDSGGTTYPGRPSTWAYKDSDSSGRVVVSGSHPESPRYDTANYVENGPMLSSMFQYAVDGLGDPRVKADLSDGAARVMDKDTSDNMPEYTKIGDKQYHHFRIWVGTGATNLTVTLDGDDTLSTGEDADLDLFCHQGDFAFRSVTDEANSSHVGGTADESVSIDNPAPGTWYIGVECYTEVVNGGNEVASYTGNLGVLNGVGYSITADVTGGDTVNDAPVITGVSASPWSVTLPAATTLSVTATDENPDDLTYTWSRVLGPDEAEFSVNGTTDSDETEVSFTYPGTYLFKVTVSDGWNETEGSVSVYVGTTEVIIDNLDDAYSQSGTWYESDALDEYAASSKTTKDAGNTATWTPYLEHAEYDVYVWYASEKPGGGYYDRDSRADFDVTHAGGTTNYELDQEFNSGQWVLLGRHTFNAGDSGKVTLTCDSDDPDKYCSADAVKFVIAGSTLNSAPLVSAPDEETIWSYETLALTAMAADDGLPSPPATMTYSWSKDSGPGSANFSSPASLSTNVSFTSAGEYVLRITADDSTLTGADTMTVTVLAPADEIIIDNLDPEFDNRNDAWSESSATDEYDASSYYADTEGAIARWTPYLENADYEVYVWYSGGNDYTRNSAADYRVYHADGSTDFVIDQNTDSGQWVQLGSSAFSFNAGYSGYAMVSHSGANSTSADAVKFVKTSSSPLLTYSTTSFNESAANDGSIDNTTPMLITLSNDTLTGSDGDDFVADGDIVVTNLPAGLTVVATRNNATELSVTISGNASSHADANDVANLTFSFQDSAFTGGDASIVTNAAKSDLSIDFMDAPVPGISIADDGSIIEGAENGELVTVTLSNATFTDPLTPANWTVTNLPAGVSKGTVTRLDATTATIALSGDRTSDYDSDITNVTVECTAAEHSGGGALTDNTGVTLTARNETINYSGATFTESGSDDGSISNSLVLTLSDDTFAADAVSGAHVTASNVPAGLSASFVRDNGTQITMSLTGNASNHANADDVSNLAVTFDDDAFDGAPASFVTNAVKSDINVDFSDPSNADYTVGASGADYTTIAAAIAACSGGEVIEVIDAVHTEDAVTVDKNNLTIQGQGMDSTIVQAGTSLAAADDRVFLVSSTISGATIKDMTLRYGDRSSNGGAIYSSTDLTLENCRITDCRASAAGGAISMGYKDDLLIGKSLTITNSVIENCESTSTDSAEGGGALFANTTGAVIIVDSTLADNTAASRGGAVRGNCDMTVTGCAVTGNTAGYYGGGFYLNDATHKVIENCTVSGNAANDAIYGGGGFYITGTSATIEIYNSTVAANSAAGYGGGMFISTYPSWVRLHNSIVADNTAAVSAADIRDGEDVGTRRISVAEYNLVESGTGNSITNGVDGNIVGSAPVLGALQNNGGPTDTIMPGVGSPALRAIPRGSEPYYNDSPAEDQRGYWIDRPTDNPDYLNRTIGACWDGATATPARGFRGRIR